MLRRYLTDEGIAVSEAADGAAMRKVLAQEQIGLVLLDLVMPGEDGLSLARDIRRQSDVPIIMLTGKGEWVDRGVGLEAGADDYIARAFHLRGVLARIRTVTRRSGGRAAAPGGDAAPVVDGGVGGGASAGVLRFGDWRLDLDRRELAQADGSPVTLTAAEFNLLRAFAEHPQQVLSRDRLMDLMKGRDWASFDRAIDTQVARLRRKIEPDPANPALIKTVRGAGYVLAAAVVRAAG